MLGNLFDTTQAILYADWVIAELSRWLPPDSDMATKSASQAAQKMNERISVRTDEMLAKSKLNVYKKAQLAARVREKMTELGYPADFVKSFSLELLTRIQAATTKLNSNEK